MSIVPEDEKQVCCVCKEPAVIVMRGYSEGCSFIYLCPLDALQLIRKLSEDVCEHIGDRHG